MRGKAAIRLSDNLAGVAKRYDKRNYIGLFSYVIMQLTLKFFNRDIEPEEVL